MDSKENLFVTCQLFTVRDTDESNEGRDDHDDIEAYLSNDGVSLNWKYLSFTSRDDWRVLTVVLVLDDLAPPGLVVVGLQTLLRHLKPLLDLSVLPTVNLEGAEDYLGYSQELQVE